MDGLKVYLVCGRPIWQLNPSSPMTEVPLLNLDLPLGRERQCSLKNGNICPPHSHTSDRLLLSLYM